MGNLVNINNINDVKQQYTIFNNIYRPNFYSSLKEEDIQDSKYTIPSDNLKENERSLSNYLKEKYSNWNYNPTEGLFENIKNTLKEYVENKNYLPNEFLGDLTAIYLMYKTNIMYSKDAKEVYNIMKPIFLKENIYGTIYKSLTPENNKKPIAYFYHIYNTINKMDGVVCVNEIQFNKLKNDQKLEVLFHEYIHVLQSLYNPEILNSKELSEGEAVAYSEMLVREVNPRYISIASEEYRIFKEYYLYRNILENSPLNTLDKIQHKNTINNTSNNRTINISTSKIPVGIHHYIYYIKKKEEEKEE